MISLFSKTEKNKKYWEERKIDWIKHYWSIGHAHRDHLIEILRKVRIKTVLEVGCGAGANLYRIKKEFPYVKIAGCDINPDAIETANQIFKAEFPAKMFEKEALDTMSEIDFRVGSAEAIPFNGEAFDLVITDAMMIYVGPDKISRVLREIRRVGYDKMIFIEFNSKSWLKRVGLGLATRYYAYDWEKLLAEKHFKYIKLEKTPNEMWEGKVWDNFGYFITSIR